jgi:hypothetical protein
MPTFTRYGATFQDGTVTQSIWSERPLTHGWRWTGQDSDGRPVGGSGFAGSEALALKQIKSCSSWLTKMPRRSKYELDRAYWKPGGVVISEEIVPTEVVGVNTVRHPPHYLVRSVSPDQILQSWDIDANLRTALQRVRDAASIAEVWDKLTEQEQRALVRAAGDRHTLDVTELFNLSPRQKSERD